MSRFHRTLLAAICLTLPVAALGQPPGHEPLPAEVGGRVATLAQAYRKLAGYADQGHVTTRITVNGQAQVVEADVPLRFQRPNKLAISVDGVQLTSDGSELLTVRQALGKYRREQAPGTLSYGLLAGGPLGAVLLGGPIEHPDAIVLTLLLADDPARLLLENVTSARVEPRSSWEGIEQPLDTLILERGSRPGLKLGIDPETGLLLAIDFQAESARLAERAPPKTSVSDYARTWRSGPIQTSALDAGLFRLEPPAHATEVAAAAARPKDKAQTHPLVGKPAPDFNLEVLASGGTRTVSRASLAGQVVVLDFWATWCGPCRLELPEIQELSERLARKHAGKVQVFAVSQDRAPDDGSSVRGLVEKGLQELKVDFARSPVARVAIDPDQATGELFQVKGIPMLVILDGRGRVQAVHTGYRGGVGEQLFEQIERLLGGGTLLDGEKANPDAE